MIAPHPFSFTSQINIAGPDTAIFVSYLVALAVLLLLVCVTVAVGSNLANQLMVILVKVVPKLLILHHCVSRVTFHEYFQYSVIKINYSPTPLLFGFKINYKL